MADRILAMQNPYINQQEVTAFPDNDNSDFTIVSENPLNSVAYQSGAVVSHEAMAHMMSQEQIEAATQSLAVLHSLAATLGLTMNLPTFRLP